MTRQEAIDLLGRLLIYCDPTDCPHNNCDKCVEAINMAGEALEQEQKIGHWIDDDNSFNSFYANCSECGYQINTHEERGYHNFCPNCGARMYVNEE